MAIGTTAAILGGSALSAGAGILGSSKAADAQKDAADSTVALQADIYEQNREDMTPWRESGRRKRGSAENGRRGSNRHFQTAFP